MKTLTTYQCISSEGGLLPADLLKRIAEGDSQLPGLKPVDYTLHRSERLTERISQSWLRLGRIWEEFKQVRETYGEHIMLSHTYEEWVQHLLGEMGYSDLVRRPQLEIEGVAYPIFRFQGTTPVHVVPAAVLLDKRQKGVAGAARKNPHAMVQEFLNRSENYLWAVVTNGMQLRILRDNEALSRPAFLEFDIEAMFDGELYAEFVVMWLTAHATRGEAEQGPAHCLWEQWTQAAEETGTRALEDLRAGVQSALEALGQGLVENPHNTALREQLRSGELTRHAFHNLLLRKIYRLLFLFVAEDRELLEDAQAAPGAYPLFKQHYSAQRWRELAGQIRGSRHHDLWEQFMLLIGALSGEAEFQRHREVLGLTALGSSLWSAEGTKAINGHVLGGETELSNERFLAVIRHLAFTSKDKVLRSVDFRNLGSEELGSVYEGLLALTPRIEGGGTKFYFEELSGNQRKTSGSYYTPDSLVQQLLSTALEPVVREKLQGKSLEDQEQALLSLSVCDPAVGSGHFLVGAAHFLAEQLGSIRGRLSGEDDVTPAIYQQALRDVIANCLYGVDLNPMAVELCKVTLWMESMEPGKPLNFLDHHIRLGNSLVGAPPDAYEVGIPDGAFKGLEGDDETALRALKKLNRERGRHVISGGLFAGQHQRQYSPRTAFKGIEELPSETLGDIQKKVVAYDALRQSPEFLNEKHLLDAWAVSFFYPKSMELSPTRYHGITNDYLDVLGAGKSQSDNVVVDRDTVESIAQELNVFHWHLEFPLVFGRGGFDVMLGNPPWEHVELKEKEWFAQRKPSISEASGATRKRMIEALEVEDPVVFNEFIRSRRMHSAVASFISQSGLFKLTAHGRINYYPIFAELFRKYLNGRGRMGIIVPTGIATDDSTKLFFQDLVLTKSLVSLFDFENKGIFPGVHASYKFALLTAGSGKEPIAPEATFAFFCHSVSDLNDTERVFVLTPEDIVLLNPNTKNCPVFRSRRDAEITKRIYRQHPVLIDESDPKNVKNPWGIRFKQGLFNMTSDSHLFRTREQLEGEGYALEGNVFKKPGEEDWLPLYEGKMFNLFDDRWAHVESDEPVGKGPDDVVMPRYWVPQAEVSQVNPLFIASRWISNATNERTYISCLTPYPLGFGNSAPIVFVEKNWTRLFLRFYALVGSFPFDFVVRQKLGGTNVTFSTTSQFVLPEPAAIAPDTWIDSLVAYLYSTSAQMVARLQELGFEASLAAWNDQERMKKLGIVNAWAFRVFGFAEEEIEHVMDSFPIVKRKEEAQYGEYRTKRLILEEFSRLSTSVS